MKDSRNPDLWVVVAPLCAAASVGTLAAILVAIRQIHPVLRIDFDLLSLAAGLVTAVVGWALGRGLWRLGRTFPESAESERRKLRRRVVWGLAGLGLLIVVGFMVAAMGIPDSRRRDMLAGGALAVLVIGAIGWILWKLARLFGPVDEPEGEDR
ncbi:MAG: hypothetical protein AB7J34_13190 [Limisphaerales bacterium]